MSSHKDFNSKRLVGSAEVAAKLRLPRRTVRRFFESGELQGFHVGRKWYMRELDLTKFIRNALNKSKL